MSKEQHFEVQGKVIEALANCQFRIELDNGHTILGHAAGKLRNNFIKIIPGDRVVSKAHRLRSNPTECSVG
jgi:translation initiation factor IF-1